MKLLQYAINYLSDEKKNTKNDSILFWRTCGQMGKFIPSLYKCKITEALYPGV